MSEMELRHKFNMSKLCQQPLPLSHLPRCSVKILRSGAEASGFSTGKRDPHGNTHGAP